MRPSLVAAAFSLFALPAAASEVPRFDFERTCRETPPVAMDRKATYEQCMADERQARQQLGPAWAKASLKARAQCASLTGLGGVPSYVELITCLEMENPANRASPDPGAASFRNPHPQPTGKSIGQ
ncbi:MAG: hypothetical protein KGM42_12695 [Hyphomicrobiales bacterium]|nr:hypothetical protein [Hyphomicrobiales bacterium]